VKLYDFDEVDERLELVPLAARRALDHAGVKLSLAGWLALPLSSRQHLVEDGSRQRVDVDRVRAIAAGAVPLPETVTASSDPPADTAPEAVVAALGQARPLPPALWSALSPLDRYALAKVVRGGRAERIAGAYKEIVGAISLSTHLTAKGEVRMVSVAGKVPTLRRARAESFVSMQPEAFERLANATAGKGDVLATARLAGVMAAKRTPELIPLCHTVALTHVHVELELDPESTRVRVLADAESFDRTGVEMEALVAASTAALTVYDMLKAYDRSMEVGPTRLLSKSGGRSGDFTR
jgi:molybdenum cofactor biosynthesis protein MoaC